jgi:hypothetical protein
VSNVIPDFAESHGGDKRADTQDVLVFQAWASGVRTLEGPSGVLSAAGRRVEDVSTEHLNRAETSPNSVRPAPYCCTNTCSYKGGKPWTP